MQKIRQVNLAAAMRVLNQCRPTETREKIKALFWRVARSQGVVRDDKRHH